MTVLDVLLAAVAIQRILLFWFKADIFLPLRKRLFNHEGWVTTFATCPMCVGFWVGVAAFLALRYGGMIGKAILIIFALSGLSQAIDLLMLLLGRLAQPKESNNAPPQQP